MKATIISTQTAVDKAKRITAIANGMQFINFSRDEVTQITELDITTVTRGERYTISFTNKSQIIETLKSSMAAYPDVVLDTVLSNVKAKFL